MLYEFIILNRDEIIRRCRSKVAARSIPPPTSAEIEHGVPLFLDQLVNALKRGHSSSPEIGNSAILHGHDLRRQGFTVSQVVHDYGDVCQSVTALAVETAAPISTDEFRMLNGCLDNAIAAAVTQFGRERNQSTIDGGVVREKERFGFFAHELRNLLQTAMIAFEVVKAGNVGAGGSTGIVLQRSLAGARALIDRSLAELRQTHGGQHREVFLVDQFIAEIVLAARLASDVRAVNLKVLPVESGVAIEADRHALAAAVTNVLQNAFKFTRPKTTVILRVGASPDRVLIEVQDRCGGLSVSDTDELFRPFEQRDADRTGVGLGLAYCRWAVEANFGRMYARTIPNEGCVFTIDLPRCAKAGAGTPHTSASTTPAI